MPDRRTRLAAAALLLAPLAYFWPLLVPVPGIQHTLIAGDNRWMYFPQRVFVARELWAGRLPLWNPTIFAGQPGLHDMQLAVFYPPTWLSALLGGPGGPPWWLFELEVLAHLGLGGLFTFLLARRLLGRGAAPGAPVGGPALIAAVSYMFGGYLTSWPLNQLNMLTSSIWLPLLLWWLDRAADGDTRAYLFAALTWTASFFAGHPQPPLYALYVAAGFLLWRAVTGRQAGRSRREAVRPLAGYALFAAVALGLAAVQILPTREIEQQSRHPQITLDEQSHGLGPAEIGALLVPLHWGNPAAYVGILPLGLALLALAVPPGPQAAPRARVDRWLWALIALAALALAFGGATPLYWLARALAPGVALIRNQERVLGVWALAAALLAGYGSAALLSARLAPGAGKRALRAAVAALALVALLVAAGVPLALRPDERAEALAYFARTRLWALLAAGALALAAVGPDTPRARRALPALLLGVIVADLYVTQGRYALVPGGNPAPVLQAVRFIQADPARPFRVSSEGLLPAGGGSGMLYGLEDVAGTGSFEPALYEEFWQRVRTDTSEGTILALLNVKYILTRRELPVSPGELTLAHEEGDLNLYRIERPLPRAYVVHRATFAADAETAAARLRAPDFDPRGEVVLAAPPQPLPDPPDAGARDAGAPDPGAPVTILASEPARLLLQAELAAPGWLVISQRAYPGWQARVDGAPAPVLAANLAFNAVALPGGRHTIEWRFEPAPVWQGAAISLLTALLVVVALVVLGRVARRRRAG